VLTQTPWRFPGIRARRSPCEVSVVLVCPVIAAQRLTDLNQRTIALILHGSNETLTCYRDDLSPRKYGTPVRTETDKQSRLLPQQSL